MPDTSPIKPMSPVEIHDLLDTEGQSKKPVRPTKKRSVFSGGLQRDIIKATSEDEKFLVKYNAAESDYEKKNASDQKKAAALCATLLMKKKVVLRIIAALHEDQIKNPAPFIMALVKISKQIKPGTTVTTKQLQTIAGEKPVAVSNKWWDTKFLQLLDTSGLTVKQAQTERRYAHIRELESQCHLTFHLCEKLGSPFVYLFERLGSTLTDFDIYTEKTKDGQLIVHERAWQTSEGKEAKRKMKKAKWLSEVKASEDKYLQLDDADFDTNNGFAEILKSYKPMWIVAVLLVVLLLTALAENQTKDKEISPDLAPVSGGFDINTIVADDDSDDFGYLLENDEASE